MAIDRRSELIHAAIEGIAAYLVTIRGANACGPNARVDVSKDGNKFDVVCNDGGVVAFSTIEM